MDNASYREIEKIAEYLIDGLINGRFIYDPYRKSAEITARQGILGEEIITVMSDGFEETRNTVTADENGEPGFVVTNPSGEEYIVSASVFRNKYEKIEGTENRYRPAGGPVAAVQVKENISFVAPWGEAQYLKAGGYLIFDDTYSDIYGVQEEEFKETYCCLTDPDFRKFRDSPEAETGFYEFLCKRDYKPVTEGPEDNNIFSIYMNMKKGLVNLSDLSIPEQMTIQEMRVMETIYLTSVLSDIEEAKEAEEDEDSDFDY